MKTKFRKYLLTASLLGLLTGGTFRQQKLWAEDTVVHVNESEAIRNATERVEPTYPPMAKQLHLQGAVQLQAHISETGVVEEVKPLTGNAVLMNAAVSAIKHWKFTPFQAGGKPAKAIADLSFNFKL